MCGLYKGLAEGQTICIQLSRHCHVLSPIPGAIPGTTGRGGELWSENRYIWGAALRLCPIQKLILNT
jgi:hypothetical protein